MRAEVADEMVRQRVTLLHGDCRNVMAELPECSVDAIVTDPPYGIGFMAKGWDTFSPEYIAAQRPRGPMPGRVDVRDGHAWAAGAYDRSLAGNRGFQEWCECWAREALRVLRPGGHMLVCGSPRTYHRMASGIEDAGFEIRDCLQYLFGSGFPKSLQVNKDGRFCACSAVSYSHAKGTESQAEYDMRRVRETDLSAAVNAADKPQEVLLKSLPEQGVSECAGETGPAQGLEGRQESSVEGRGDVLQDARELHGSPLRESAGMGEADGAGGRLHNGASPDSGEVVRETASEDGSSKPSRPQAQQQRARKSRTLADERGSQEGGVWPLCDRCGKPTLPPGIGTALKPAYEPIVLARKSLRGTVAGNVAAFGTGGLNIDGCRIGDADTRNLKAGGANDFPHEDDAWAPKPVLVGSASGRWPANVLLDDEAARLLDNMTGNLTAGGTLSGNEPSKPFDGPDIYGTMDGRREWQSYADVGGASRFFYTSKTSRAEREFGLDDLEPTRRSDGRDKDIENPRLRTNQRRNDHPTVKPVDLMRWLCRLVTQPGGTILDPFLGSGSTGMAALDEGFRFIGIDLEQHYLDIAQRRIGRRHLLDPMPARESGQGALLLLTEGARERVEIERPG